MKIFSGYKVNRKILIMILCIMVTVSLNKNAGAVDCVKRGAGYLHYICHCCGECSDSACFHPTASHRCDASITNNRCTQRGYNWTFCPNQTVYTWYHYLNGRCDYVWKCPDQITYGNYYCDGALAYKDKFNAAACGTNIDNCTTTAPVNAGRVRDPGNDINCGFIDIGLRVYNGVKVVAIACERGVPTSPLRIVGKDGKVYGVALVEVGDPNTSGVRIRISSTTTKALRKYP